MSAASRRLKDALLERYLADALDEGARRELERVLSESEPDRERVAELRADSQAFLTLHPPRQLVERLEKEQARRRWWRLPALVAPLAAAAALAGVMVVAWPAEDPYAVKGRLTLSVHRRAGSSSARVPEGQALHPGDAIRFELNAAGPGFVAVIGRDAQGKVTVYHPFDGKRAAPYQPGSPLLPVAIELDGELGEEVLFGLHGPAPFELAGVVAALEAGKDPAEAAPGVDLVRHALLKR